MRQVQQALMLSAFFFLTSQASFAQQIAAGGGNKAAIVNPSSVLEHKNSEAADIQSTETDYKVMAKFSTMFVEAKNPQWKTVGKFHHVSFNNNGSKARAVFTSKGILSYLITDFTLDQLPELLRSTIIKDYPGFTLIKAIEVRSSDKVTYQAVIESDQSFVMLRSTSDGMEEIKEVQKTK